MDPISAALIIPVVVGFVQVIMKYRQSKKLKLMFERQQQQWREEMEESHSRREAQMEQEKEARRERERKAQRDREMKAQWAQSETKAQRAQSQSALKKEGRTHLKQDKEWERKMEEQEKEWERRMEEQKEAEDKRWSEFERERNREREAREDQEEKARQERESEAQKLREDIKRERLERKESERLRAMEFEHLKRVVKESIKLFFYMLHRQQQSRARTGRIQSEDYPYSDESQVYKQLLSALDLPGETDDVNNDILLMFNQSLPMLEDNPNNSSNTDGSSRLGNSGKELALLELPEQLPEGFEDNILNSVWTMMNVDNSSASFAAENPIVDLNQRYGDLKISTPINDGTQAKEQGNVYFKDQNYTEAIKCYSTSINQSATATAYGNRAMVYIKLKKFIEAEKDCTKALRIDENYFKAYARRAVARAQLGSNLKGALEDVEVALKTDPTNIDMRQLRAELREMLGYHGNAPTGSLAIIQ